jgi:hypothetical protein
LVICETNKRTSNNKKELLIIISNWLNYIKPFYEEIYKKSIDPKVTNNIVDKIKKKIS